MVWTDTHTVSRQNSLLKPSPTGGEPRGGVEPASGPASPARKHRAGKRIAGGPGRPFGHLGAPVGGSELLGPARTRLIATKPRPEPGNPGREVWRPVRRGLRCRPLHLCGFIIRGGRPPRVHAQRGGTAHLRRPHAGRLRHRAQAFRGPHGIVGLSGTASAKPPLSREAALPPWGRQANGPKPQRTSRPQPPRRRPRLGDAAQGAARVRGDLR